MLAVGLMEWQTRGVYLDKAQNAILWTRLANDPKKKRQSAFFFSKEHQTNLLLNRLLPRRLNLHSDNLPHQKLCTDGEQGPLSFFSLQDPRLLINLTYRQPISTDATRHFFFSFPLEIMHHGVIWELPYHHATRFSANITRLESPFYAAIFFLL